MSDNIHNYLFNEPSLFVIIIDQKLNIVRANKNATDTLNITHQTLMAAQFYEYCEKIKSPFPFKNINTITHTVKNVEWTINLKEKLNFLCDIVPTSENSNSVTQFYLICKKKSVAVQTNNDDSYLYNIINNLPHFIFWKDTNLVFKGCNKNFAITAGFPDEKDVINKSDFDMPWSQEAKEYQADDKRILTAGIAKLNYEEEQTQQDGSIHTMLVSKVPMYNNDKLSGILGIYTDITERKKMEEDLKAAKIESEKANEAKSNFIANMSHDIRTPITGMLGLAEELKDNATSEDDYNSCELLISATQELLTLLNEIISVLNLKSGNLQNRASIFSVHDVMRHNLSLLKPAANHKGLELRVLIDNNVPLLLEGNQTFLDRIILNLMSNAIKFTDQGHVAITISSTQKTKGSVQLRISVEDTGIGIPNDKFNLIFESFSRLNPSYQGKYQGSGIGLYTIKQYIDALNGTIDLKSKEGLGSTFTVSIPLNIAEELDNITKKDKVVKKNNDNNNILVIEDNQLAARMACYILENCGCTTTIASTGLEAVEKSKENDFDLIFLDIGLPDIAGVDVAKLLRRNRIDTPIIALTGHLLNEEKETYHDAGIQDVIIKPLSTDVAIKILNEFC